MALNVDEVLKRGTDTGTGGFGRGDGPTMTSRIFDVLSQTKAQTAEEIAKKVDVTKAQVNQTMYRLVSKGRVERKYVDDTAYYFLGEVVEVVDEE